LVRRITLSTLISMTMSRRRSSSDNVPARMRWQPQPPSRILWNLSRTFPSGVGYVIAYNPTEFIQLSIDEVKETLLIAVFLVALVVILFLQTWRAAVIPVLAIPISLFGSFLVMRATGIGLNTLSLFGLVLSIGIVVDDAMW
jgi:multidrug efflux pump subunit AcrB